MRFAALVCIGIRLMSAADWPMAGFDAASSNCQPHETILNETTVRGLTLLWRKHLAGSLSSPVILGRVITHRGFQELVFVTSSGDAVYAIDADLGRMLWQRKLDNRPSAARRPITPVFYPAQPDIDDDDDDGSPPPQPLFVLSTHSELFALRTISGENEIPPRPLRASKYSSLMALPQNVRPVERIAESAVCGDTRYLARNGQLQALRSGSKLWSRKLNLLTPPVVANGLLYALVKIKGHTQLAAVDAESGQQIAAWPVEGSIGPAATLAAANGHIVFTTAEGSLYCFGLPLDL